MSAAPINADPQHTRTPGYNPAAIVLTACAAGIVFDRYRPLPFGVWLAIAVAAFGAFLSLRRRASMAWSVALLISAAAVAASWHHYCWCLFGADDISLFARSAKLPVCIEAVALKSPRLLPPQTSHPLSFLRAGDQVQVEVELRAIRDGDAWRPASGRAWLTVEALLPDLQAGDRFRAFAHLTQIEPAMNPGELDRAANQRGNRVGAYLQTNYTESIALLDKGSRFSPRRLLDQLRRAGQAVFQRYLRPQQAAAADAVLLGLREQLDPDEISAFQETGTIHLVVIAGLHLGILASAASFVLRRILPRRLGLPAVAAFAVGYMLLVDAEPPIVRATVLVATTCFAAYIGRGRAGVNALALAGLVVLAINPVDLFRVGPQLSFLCVAGLMWLAPMWMFSVDEPDPLAVVELGDDDQRRHQRPIYVWLRKHIFWNDQPGPIEKLLASQRPWPVRIFWLVGRVLRHITLVSGAIWLCTMPLVMARFHIFNPVAVLLNTLVWIPMAAALVSGLALLLCSLLPGPLASLCAMVCNSMISVVEALVRLGQRAPLGHFWVPGPAEWWLIGFYAAIGLLIAFPRLRPPVRWRWALLGAWTTIGFIVPWWTADRHGLRCTFLSVGHGEAIVLELPSGQTILYDAGRLAAPTACCRVVSGYLWSRGLTHIDAVVLSHADTDHYNALPGLLDRFSVGVVYVSPVMFDQETAAVRFLKESIQRAKVPIRVTASGDRMAGGPGCSLTILHPPPQGLPSTSNANSIVLSIEYAGRRIFLPADLQSPGLDDVLAEQPLHCDVLLVPHHGSRSSKPFELSAWSTPNWSVFSADHRYDTRSVEAVYSRYGHTLHTADTGAVTARIDEKGLRVETFAQGR